MSKMIETEYIHDAKWFEKNTPKCPNCGENMQTVYASKTHKDKPKEFWMCPVCGYAIEKIKK